MLQVTDAPTVTTGLAWYMHGAPASFSNAVRDVLSNTYHDRYTDTGGSMPDMNPLDTYL
jgi:hypothetical protein